MIILPAIDIKDGNCVRLYKGDFATVEKVANSYMDTAKSFVASGASWIHMVDLDGAKDGTLANKDIFVDVAKSTPLKVELGGGIRDLNAVEGYLSAGIARVIIGSVAVKNPELVRTAVLEYGERIAVGIDAKNGMVATEGWVEDSGIDYIDLARQMTEMGIQYIIFTDISKDGTLDGPNLEQLERINREIKCNIIASGGISNINDIIAVKKLGLYGTICGKSIYKGTLNLSNAIEIGEGE